MRRVAILVFPFAAANTFSFARKLAEAAAGAGAQTTLLSGGIPEGVTWPRDIQVHDIGVRLHYVRGKRPLWLSALLWIIRFVQIQVGFTIEILRRRAAFDLVICSLGTYYQMPVLAARLCGKKVIVTCFSDYAVRTEMNYGNRLLAALMDGLVHFEYRLADAILVDSLRLVDERPYLAPYLAKIYYGALFVEDLEHFSIRLEIDRSSNLAGFIGRFMADKGIREFLQAIPMALRHRPDLQFLVIGTGGLDQEIEKTLQEQHWSSQVEWIKWVDHEDLPAYLNRLSLLVMPSYTEGLPILALEAMACGAPLLATGVGGIPDLIIPGETGFLLQDSSPETIAASLLRALDDPHLEQITQRARALIEQSYSLGAAIQRYQEIIDALIGDGGDLLQDRSHA